MLLEGWVVEKDAWLQTGEATMTSVSADMPLPHAVVALCQLCTTLTGRRGAKGKRDQLFSSLEIV